MEDRVEDKKKRNRIIILILALLLLLGGAAGYYYYTKQAAVPMISADILPDGEDATDMVISEKAQEVADANYFTLQVNPDAYYKDGESTGSIEIVNPGTNVYPIAVDVTLEDTGENIYSSGAIYPNQQVSNVKLEKALAKGDYQAVATVNIYDPDTKEKKGVTEALITIHVEN